MDSKLGRKAFVNMKLSLRLDRNGIGRGGDDPGEGFIYVLNTLPQVEDRLEWLEVTEVFTTLPASQIVGARAWNGIPKRHTVDSDEFRRIPIGPSAWTPLED